MRKWALVLVLVGPVVVRVTRADDTPSPAVAAYLASAAKHRGEALEEMKASLKQQERLLRNGPKVAGETVGQARARKKKQREDVKGLQAKVKDAESGDAFVPALIGAPRLYVGYAGHVGGARPATAKILQIVDGEAAIVQIGKRDFWLSGLATGNLEDGGGLVLNGVVYCSGNKTYTTVTGGSKTVLVLESFDERDVLPYLPDNQREALRQRIDADVEASKM